MNMERPYVEHLELAGFKSIRQASLDLTRLNVLIGSNGAGKSNLVSSFAMLSASLNRKLDEYIGKNGGPNTFLHLGAKFTDEISTSLTVHTPAGRGMLQQRLRFRPPDGLYYYMDHKEFPENLDRSHITIMDGRWTVINIDGADQAGPRVDHFIYHFLKNWLATYHLADTSLTSAIRTEGYIEDNRQIHPDGGNLAAIL